MAQSLCCIRSGRQDHLPNWTDRKCRCPSARLRYEEKVRTVALLLLATGLTEATRSRKATLVANGKSDRNEADVKVSGGRAGDSGVSHARCSVWADPLRSASSMPATHFRTTIIGIFSVERADPKPAFLVYSENDTASPLYLKTALQSSTDAAFYARLRNHTCTGDLMLDVLEVCFRHSFRSPGPICLRSLKKSLERPTSRQAWIYAGISRHGTPRRAVPYPLPDIPITANPYHSARETETGADRSADRWTRIPSFGKTLKTGTAWSRYSST